MLPPQRVWIPQIVLCWIGRTMYTYFSKLRDTCEKLVRTLTPFREVRNTEIREAYLYLYFTLTIVLYCIVYCIVLYDCTLSLSARRRRRRRRRCHCYGTDVLYHMYCTIYIYPIK